MHGKRQRPTLATQKNAATDLLQPVYLLGPLSVWGCVQSCESPFYLLAKRALARRHAYSASRTGAAGVLLYKTCMFRHVPSYPQDICTRILHTFLTPFVLSCLMQSDASELVGGYKPVELQHIARPLYVCFSKLFSRTFSTKSNAVFFM